jgi:hypothetical protein
MVSPNAPKKPQTTINDLEPTKRERRSRDVRKDLANELRSRWNGNCAPLQEEQIRRSKRRSNLGIYHADTLSSNETHDNRTNQWPSG